MKLNEIKPDIDKIMKDLTKDKYTMTKHGVDVAGDVTIPKHMREIPVKFNIVDGIF